MSALELSANQPEGAIETAWSWRCADLALVGPVRRRQRSVIVVGSGLAGAAAAASLSELGYRVRCMCISDSPRRAHSVAAQGGINAAKNYGNDGDSIGRLFADTLRGGDYRAREANVYRLAELSLRVIDQCAAQGVPFAREYGGLLANRSFGGALVSRTFYARGQTGQQLLLGAYQALSKEIAAGGVDMLPRRDVLDIVVAGGRARGVIARNLCSGALETHLADAVVLATGGYANVFFHSTNARASNATAIVRAYRRGAAFANPSFVQFHPTCLPASDPCSAKLTLMSESLRNDGRVWVPRAAGDPRSAAQIPEAERDYYLERMYPRYGNLTARDVASRAAKAVCDEGRGVGPTKRAVYLDLAEALGRLGHGALRERYGNLFELYEGITGEDPLQVPMRIYPAAHYSMGGLWVDYDLMSTLPGLFVIGEANFSDHGANRLGASALMQGLADGYFIAPMVVGGYLASHASAPISESTPEARAALDAVQSRLQRLVAIGGRRSAHDFHRTLGEILWRVCGLQRERAELVRAQQELAELRAAFDRDLCLPRGAEGFDQALEHAARVEDFLELGALMCRDALEREESCGCHFRAEHARPDGEGARDDARFAHVAAFVHEAAGPARRVIEPLSFRLLTPSERSYR